MYVCMYVFKVLANEDTLLRTQMFPRLPARATFVADTNFVSGTQKMFLILVRNISCPQHMFPSLRNMEQHGNNNVSATMCPRLPVPLQTFSSKTTTTTTTTTSLTTTEDKTATNPYISNFKSWDSHTRLAVSAISGA